ncbi:crotonobetaine/carnitine-CoA ligase [Eggerthella sinensis]|uniref:Crotonobetaine/carnitine-CoA ligase n=1 Tax=Eggerthella sinensis TaxID=242230 RepID=A0A3N0IV26_9ACTN|nr:crotonobetaine/carnitine-CoA ligase [Eggerthella sinensis]RDB68614.1 crotonobetaine/carnitine-CoA ligase [Eggerthella sinensis]RNM40202.1 crotonobetaine/carnitine-CoA ligase [Eggerthella sinensis]
MTDIVGNETVRSLWDGLVAACGDRVFLRFRDRADATSTYTYRAFNEEIDRTANVFLSMGVQAGERVCVQLCTCPEFMMCLFGLAKIGAVMVPMNEQNLVEEAAYVLDRTGATCALVEPKFLDLYRAVRAEGPYLPKGVLVARTAEEGVEGLGEALAALEQDDALRDFSQLRAAAAAELDEVRPLSADDPAEIIFTSGTTSRPKGVVLTHANILFSGLYGDWEVTLTRDDRLLTTMPACHSNFQLAALMPVLTAGAELIVVEKYSARRFWSQIREFGATVTQCVAMMLRTLMLQPASPDDRNHTLREMLYFLPVSDAEKAAFEERFGVRLMNTYGSTESIGWVLTDPPAGPRRWPSVGRAGLGYEVRIMREDGVQAAPGEIGEIQVHGQRGRTIMKEYFNDPEATARTFTDDGWLKTGDKGYVDEDGWFFFVDRKVNMIKRAGENISTTELENVLVDHPLIAEAAVIGVDDPIRDQAVKAFVLPCAGAELTEEDVLSYCEGHMAGFKVPSYVEIVHSFPRTCSMKIEKRLLR